MPTTHRPDIHVAPPLVFATGFVAGYLLHRFWIAINLVSRSASPAGLRGAGIVLALFGVVLALWGVMVFRRARTTIMPFRASTAIVQSGPYRFTRNPMYVGMTLAYIGAALVLNTGWPLVLLPIVLLALVQLVISREEAFLAATFGREYLDYQQRVRRWL